ncbi:MAG: hypothetical protein AUH83_10100 [Deltaproteobacteria bacterium 13_1_40CM_4_68_19]|nr:MAG: hypothetical protein AUH83_10100 [Deltaproteobacteria bacterium 13_1_40CM_4_68_19]OLD33314.1 MAG: hypothetical protein AUI19_04705 [Myxococcales bacterium 13_1_40CM_2_68_15]
MRRTSLLSLVTLALACSGGRTPSSDTSSTAVLAELADAGNRCVHREAPPFHACDGLDAGAACSVTDDDRDAGQASCKALHDGRLVCAGTEEGDENSEEGECGRDDDADDGGAEHHRACDAGVPGDDDGDGGLRHKDGGLAAPIQAAVDACAQHAAGDACSFTFKDRGIQGACRQLSSSALLICAPLCAQR